MGGPLLTRNIARSAAGALAVLIFCATATADLPRPRHIKLPYRPRWVTVLKKGRIFKYKRKEFSSPRILGDRLYVGSDAGYLYAIKKKTGRKAWRFKTVGTVNSSPAFLEDKVVFGDDKGILYAVTLAKGKEVWRRELGSEILTEPAVFKEKVYVASAEGKVIALRGEDGEPIWERDKEGEGNRMTIRGNAPPAVDESSGRLFVGFADGGFWCLNLADGKLLWEKSFRNESQRFQDIDMKPLVEKDRLYLATFDGKVYALSKKNGQVLWSQSVGSGVRFLASEDRLFVSGSDGVLYALSKSDGSKIWERDLKMKGRGALTTPILYKDILAVGLSEQTMNFVDAAGGRLLYRRFAKKGVFSDPILDENKIYYLSNGGRLYSLKFVR